MFSRSRREPASTISFPRFTPVAPIPRKTIKRYESLAPAGAAEMWRHYGTGIVGDGFVRVLDPARADQMLDGMFSLSDRAVMLFSTALADLVFFVDDVFIVIKFRLGVIEMSPRGVGLEEFTAWLQDEQLLTSRFDQQPYPEAAARDGIPPLEKCYGFVPLLALGGPPQAANLQLMGMYEHIAVMLQLAEPPRMVGLLPGCGSPQGGAGGA